MDVQGCCLPARKTLQTLPCSSQAAADFSCSSNKSLRPWQCPFKEALISFLFSLSFSRERATFSKALEPHNPPQQLSKASRLLGRGTSLGPTSCFSWASKLLCGTFWAGLESLKTSAAAFEGLRTHNPPQQPSKACRLLGHGTSLGPTSYFYWASKLLCGTFWASLKSLKTSAAAFEGLRTSQPSAAPFEGVPLAWPWYLPRPHKLFLLGFETAMWHVLGRP